MVLWGAGCPSLTFITPHYAPCFTFRGWVQEVFPMHNTLVYSMGLAGDSVHQQGAVEAHGQATRKQT